MKILIIGGSRFVGPLVIRGLLDNKHEVTVFNRGKIKTDYPDGVKFVQGDRDEGFKFTQKFDVVIDMCAYNGFQTERAINYIKFDYFLHFSTVAVYKKTEYFPISSGLGEWPVWGEYNKGKVECETVLKNGGIKYGSIRPVYILGPNNYMDRERFIYSKIKKGKITLPGDGQAIVQFVFADEVAQSIVLMAEKKLQGDFNCAGDDLVTLKGLVEMMAANIGEKVKIEYNPKTDGENWDETEFPFANEHIIVDNSRLKELGANFLPLGVCLDLDYQSWYKDKI